MAIFWIIIGGFFFQTDERLNYEGTLTLSMDEACEALPQEQRVTLVLKETKAGFEGYLSSQDHRLAKITGSSLTNLQLALPGGEPEVATWNLSLENNGDTLHGSITGFTLKNLPDCRVKKANVSLEPDGESIPNWEKCKLEFLALTIAARIRKEVQEGDSKVALNNALKAIRLGTGREEVHRAAALALRAAEDRDRSKQNWLEAAEMAEQEKKPNLAVGFRASVAFFESFRGDQNFETQAETALAHYQRAIELAPDHHEFMSKAGKAYAGLGQEDEAVNWYQKAVEAALDKENREAAHQYHTEISEIRGAYPDWAEAITEEASRLPDTPEIAEVLEKIRVLEESALIAKQKGHYQSALPPAKKALDLAQTHFGPKHPRTINLLNNLAGIYSSLGDYDQAQPLFENANGLCEQVFGEHHPITLTSVGGLALLFELRGYYDRAQHLYERALNFSYKVLGESHPDTLTIENNLAGLFYRQGSYDQAQSLWTRVLEQRKKEMGQYHPNTLVTISNLVALHIQKGNYHQAQPLAEQALEFRMLVLGEHHPGTLTSLNNLGALYTSQGAYKRAQPLFERALELQTKFLGERHPDTLVSLGNLAFVNSQQGAHHKAQSLLENALEIREQALGTIHPDTLLTLSNLATVYEIQGKYDRAQSLYSRALKHQEQVLGEGHPNTLSTLNNLAYLYKEQGAYDKAQSLRERFLRLSKETLGNNHPSTLAAINNLGYLAFLRDQPALARDYYLQSLEISSSFLQQLSAFSRPMQRVFLDRQDGFRHMFFSMFTENPNPVMSLGLFRFSLARKGLLFHAGSHVIGQALNLAKSDPNMGYKIYDLRLLRRQMSQLFLSGSKNDPRMKALEKEMEKLEAEFGQGMDTVPDQVDFQLDSALAELSPANCLVDLHVFDKWDIKQDKKKGEWAVALVVDSQVDEVVRMVDLGPTEPILRDLAYFRKGASNPANDKLVRQAAHQLYLRLWKPLEPYIHGKDNVYLVPDGFLNLVPFAALMDENGQWLGTQISLGMLSTARDLLSGPAQNTPTTGPHLVFAPDFDLPPNDPAESPETGRLFTPVPGTALEGEMLARRFRISAQEPHIIQGKGATELIVAGISSPSLLHIASHGFFLGSLPVSRDGLEDLVSMRNIQFNPSQEPTLPTERPLLGSGLALAGANAAARGQVDKDGTDGLLTALEVLSMDLRGTELVVLSACETGVGETNLGEGVYSLNRAFLEAGANAVMATLWSVDDEATALFMDHFYGLFLNGATPREAQRMTQQHFIQSEKWKHPYFWAPFVLVGGK